MTTDSEQDALVASWFEYQRSHDDAQFWAVARVIEDAILHPERTWVVVLRLLEAARDEWEVSMVGAGPLEDLLVRNGPAFIARIEFEAARNPVLIEALSSVWFDATKNPDVARRIDVIVAGTRRIN